MKDNAVVIFDSFVLLGRISQYSRPGDTPIYNKDTPIYIRDTPIYIRDTRIYNKESEAEGRAFLFCGQLLIYYS